ncbi:MAG: hypothetical protein OXU53_08580, partial [Deltaproteobacteria bacterium]|nr:hypothetical protein [Deltaproteobacteria bacterium]
WLVAGQAWAQTTPMHTFTVSAGSATIAERTGDSGFGASTETYTIRRDTTGALMDGQDIVIEARVVPTGSSPAERADFLTEYPIMDLRYSGTDREDTFSVNVYPDALNEGNETFNITFRILAEDMAAATANGGVALPSDFTVTITDDPGDALSVSIAESNSDDDSTTMGTQVREGRVALFTVTLNKASEAAISVPYSIGGGVAAADYTDAGGGTLSIPLTRNGLSPTTGIIRIALLVDSDADAEDLTVTLGATASEYSAAGTIARTSATADQSATISVVSRPSSFTRTLTVTPAAGPHPEGDANATHAFTISFQSGDTAFTEDTEVTWNIVHGGTNAEDFTVPGGADGTSGIVIFPMGSTASVDFTVTIVGDNVNEPNESFGVQLTAPDTMTALGNPSNDSSMVVINDDDPIVLTYSGGGQVAETAGAAVIMLDFGAVLSGPVRVRFNAIRDADANTANAELGDLGETGVDWLPAGRPTLLRAQINRPIFTIDRGATDDLISGTTTGQIPVPITDDTFNEPNEVFHVVHTHIDSGAHGPVTVAGSPQIYTIVDDDPMTLSVTADKTTVNEGQEVQFSFELTGAARGSLADLLLRYTLTGVTFTPVDSGSRMFTFAAGTVGGRFEGATSGAVTVGIPLSSTLGDADPDQTLIFTITGIERADSTMPRAPAEDDPLPGVINLPDQRATEVTVNFVSAAHSFGFSAPTRRISETDTDATTTYTVNRSGPDISSGGSITITWAYAAGTTNPVAAADFMSDTAPAGGTLEFTGSEISETFTISTKGDNLNEADETFTLTLSIASAHESDATDEGGASLPASALTVAIADDDTLRLQIDGGAVSVEEGMSAELTVTPMDATRTADIVFPYGFVPSSASGSVEATAADYTDPGSGSITIASSDSSGTITINIVDDGINEADENLRIVYGTSWRALPTSAGRINPPVVTTFFTLTDNDAASLSIAADTDSTREGGTASFTVTTDTESAGDIRVAWTAAVSGEQGTANPMS